jgi:hypothetical protein
MDAALMQNFLKGFGTPYIICPYSCKYLHRGPDSKVIEYNRYEDIPEGIRNFYIIPTQSAKRSERMPLINRDRNEFFMGLGNNLMYSINKWIMRKKNVFIRDKWGGFFCQTVSFDNYEDVPEKVRIDYEIYESIEIARIAEAKVSKDRESSFSASSGCEKKSEPDINELDMSNDLS